MFSQNSLKHICQIIYVTDPQIHLKKSALSNFKQKQTPNFTTQQIKNQIKI